MKNKIIVIAILILIIICAVIGFVYYKNRDKNKEVKMDMSNGSLENTTQNYTNKNDILILK